ncbi:MAG: M48 family metallopeptidase [Opitutaceae bacterium]|nr:M48 family metallopeptidase [Cytophagales bacterium]
MGQQIVLGNKIDSQATNVLLQFADKIHLSDWYKIEITILGSQTVNAYALPGGNVVVYSGIINKIKTPEALAALLSHACTHVNERHTLRSLLRCTANGIVISVIFGDATGISGAIVSYVELVNGLRYSWSLKQKRTKKAWSCYCKTTWISMR